jgi:hypothetical protein
MKFGESIANQRSVDLYKKSVHQKNSFMPPLNLLDINSIYTIKLLDKKVDPKKVEAGLRITAGLVMSEPHFVTSEPYSLFKNVLNVGFQRELEGGLFTQSEQDKLLDTAVKIIDESKSSVSDYVNQLVAPSPELKKSLESPAPYGLKNELILALAAKEMNKQYKSLGLNITITPKIAAHPLAFYIYQKLIQPNFVLDAKAIEGIHKSEAFKQSEAIQNGKVSLKKKNRLTV